MAGAIKISGWIAESWVRFISSFMIGARFSRGKTYANKGQVLDIAVEPGIVSAKVQGSRRKPYDIKIKFQTLTQTAWENIAQRLRADAVLCAQVLSGHFPAEFETFFEREGASLFPKLENDSSMDCSCPDWSVPCKHIVAVFFLLGEAFEQDPFLILKLRGIEREIFLSLIGIKNEQKIPGKIKSSFIFIKEELPFVPIPNQPSEPAQILDEFGAFPFWKGKQTIKQKLAPIYERASNFAEELLDDLS